MSSNVMVRSHGERTFDIFNCFFMVILAISVLFPFWQLFLLSFATTQDASSLGFHIWNRKWTTSAYIFVSTNKYIIYAFVNSIFRSVVTTILMLFTTLLGAYPLAKKDLPARKIFTGLFVFPMFFNGGLIPYFLLMNNIHLMNSIWVYIIPCMVGSFNILFTRNFIMSLDKALEESALIDGANQFTVLFRIIAPLSKPILATVALWTLVAQWNAWFDALLFITDQKKMVLQLVLQQMLKLTYMMGLDFDNFRVMAKSKNINMEIFAGNVRAATVMITIGPIVLAYPFLQKYFIKGIMIGSLKG